MDGDRESSARKLRRRWSRGGGGVLGNRGRRVGRRTLALSGRSGCFGVYGAPMGELSGHEVCFATFLGMLREEIGEEKDLQDSKHDEKLDADDQPQGLPQRHRPETIVIEVKSAG